MTALLAFLAMFATDVVGTIMVIAESDRNALLSALGDTIGYLLGFVCNALALGSYVKYGLTPSTLIIIGAVSLANFSGTWSGVKIGERWMGSAAKVTVKDLDARLRAVESRGA